MMYFPTKLVYNIYTEISCLETKYSKTASYRNYCVENLGFPKGLLTYTDRHALIQYIYTFKTF